MALYFGNGPKPHSIELAGETCYTTIPESVDLFDIGPYGLQTAEEAKNFAKDAGSKDLRFGYNLIPSALDSDKLKAGTTYAFSTQPLKRGLSATPRQQIVMHSTEHGKAVDEAAFSQKQYVGFMGAAKLLSFCGFTSKGDQLLTLPTPVTFQKAAAEQGLSVRLFPEYGEIPADEYLGAFADGAYPVGTKAEELYPHDIGTAHMPALLLGGTMLKEILAERAQNGLRGNNRTRDIYTMNLDGYTTALLIHTLDNGRSTPGLRHADESLVYHGEKIGISRAVSHEIVEAVKTSAHTYGLKTIDCSR